MTNNATSQEDSVLERVTTPQVRQWFYTISTAVLALLVGYDIVAAEQVPLWLGVCAAVFAISATGTAATVVRKQRADGTLD